MATDVKNLETYAIIGFDGSAIRGLKIHPGCEHIVYPMGNKVCIQEWKTKKMHFLSGHTNSDKEKCNVLNMAEAGFYSMATGSDDADAAKCFLCGKEMDGWEAGDDPWAEHESHAPKCAFVQLRKNEDMLTLLEYLSVMKQHMINEVNQIAEFAKQKVNEKAKSVRRRCLSKK